MDAHTDPAGLANLLKDKEKIKEEIEDFWKLHGKRRKPN